MQPAEPPPRLGYGLLLCHRDRQCRLNFRGCAEHSGYRGTSEDVTRSTDLHSRLGHGFGARASRTSPRAGKIKLAESVSCFCSSEEGYRVSPIPRRLRGACGS
jgi:hypothetical protein